MNVRHIIHNVMLSASAAWVFGSCSMMTADLEGCPTGLYVNFVYDYNIQHADMLKDHVGGLVLCVYDESDVLVARRQMTAGELSRYGSYLHFSESELAPGHQYRLVAVALQKEWASALQPPAPSTYHRRTPPSQAMHASPDSTGQCIPCRTERCPCLRQAHSATCLSGRNQTPCCLHGYAHASSPHSHHRSRPGQAISSTHPPQ